MDLVPADRAAEGRAELLVRVGKHPVHDEVARVPAVAPKVTGGAAGERVGSRFGHGVDLHARRAALAGVEPVGDELELGDRVAAVVRLAEAGRRNRGRHLVTVDVQLGRAYRGFRHQVVAGHRVDAAPRRQHRQVEPVPAVDRKLGELPRIDVARLARLGRRHERRLAGDRDRFLHRRGRQLEVHDGLLADQQLQPAARHDREALQLRGHAIRTGAQGNLKGTALVRHPLERIAGRVVDRGHRDPGQHPAGGIGHRSAERRVLCVGDNGQRQDQHDSEQPATYNGSHELLLASEMTVG